jgi:hypothetical protein
MERDMSRHAVLVSGSLERSSPKGLEDDADRVLDVLEDEFEATAIGPVVGCDLDRSVIDVLFSVEAENAAEVHRRISEIVSRIDESIDGSVKTATTPADQLEATCA